MSLRSLFEPLGAKVVLLTAFGFVSVTSLLWLNALSIETLLVVWYVIMFLFIVEYERQKRKRDFNILGNFTEDQKWVSAKNELENIDSKIKKTSDEEKKKQYRARKLCLENELRRLEWSIKESNINALYNAQSGRLKELDQDHNSGEDDETLDRATSETPERKSDAISQKSEAQTLEMLIAKIEDAIRRERPETLSVALQPLLAELKAHHNRIKSVNPGSENVANYWAVWATTTSIVSPELKNPPDILRYVSKKFRQKIEHLLKISAERRAV